MLKKIRRISMNEVLQHYEDRKHIHRDLVNFLKANNELEYVHLALGITDSIGNYSSDEHKLGPRILSETSTTKIFKLAKKLFNCSSVNHIPRIIYEANIPFLKISVGSEMAMMLNPNKFWVGNVRTIWVHLLIKHNWDYNKANEELELYRNDDISSEMIYKIWRDIYLSMETNLDHLIELANKSASHTGVTKGNLKYMWADAMANAIYDDYSM